VTGVQTCALPIFDANRNVAAAVSEDKLGELMMAAKLFLSKPEISFFAPDEIIPLSAEALNERLSELHLVFIVFKSRETVPDVLWGQLYKTSRALVKLLTQNDFQVLKSDIWSEKKVNALVFGLESITISPTKRHIGPPLDSKEAIRFIEKYTEEGRVIIGPWAEGGRWIIGVRRRHVDATSLLIENLKNGGKSVGVSSGLAGDIKEAKIYVNKEILNFCSSNVEFAKFLAAFIKGKPKWMK